MKKTTLLCLIGFACFWILAACGQAPGGDILPVQAPGLDYRDWSGTPFTTAVPAGAVSHASTSTHIPPTKRPRSTATAAPTIESLTQVVSLPLETPRPSLTPIPTLTFVERICSPLEFVELKDLPKIVSDRYNPPPMGSDARHQGVDFAYYQWKGKGLLEGTPIHSVFAGRIAASVKNSFPFGNMLIVETGSAYFPAEVREIFGIQPGESLYLLYAHMNDESLLISLGESVRICEPIGYVGQSGNADAAHLHLEMRVGPAGTIFEGFSAFRDTDSKEEKQNYRTWRTSGSFLHFDPMRMLLFEFSHGATATPTPGRTN
jgi:murein DD-endopeptidase MepM/ murein hydrolase activator NlpD